MNKLSYLAQRRFLRLRGFSMRTSFFRKQKPAPRAYLVTGLLYLRMHHTVSEDFCVQLKRALHEIDSRSPWIDDEESSRQLLRIEVTFTNATNPEDCDLVKVRLNHGAYPGYYLLRETQLRAYRNMVSFFAEQIRFAGLCDNPDVEACMETVERISC